MRRLVETEETICDLCQQEKAFASRTCLRCQKDICYKCIESGAAKEFQHAVQFSGSGDGCYCSPCIAAMADQADPLFLAYMTTISNLRMEAKAVYADFEKRSTAAGERIKLLRAQRGLR